MKKPVDKRRKHEKAVPHGVSRNCGAVRHHLRLRRKDRRAGGGESGGSHRPAGGKDRRHHRGVTAA